MRQRALIAMTLACEPGLLIADEPTTALDVTVQAQFLDLLHTLREETGMGLLLVMHDVGVAAESVDEVLVMRHGRVVEHGPVATVLGSPAQPYTRELLGAVPRVDAPRSDSAAVEEASDAPTEVVLEATGLRREFGRGKEAFTAVDDVSLTIHRGETLGIVGKSGSGKTTVGRMLVGLLEPTAGEVPYDGHARVGLDPAVQMVFQDPVSSLTPAGAWVSRSPTRSARVGSRTRGASGACAGTAGGRGARSGALRPLPARVSAVVSASASA